MAAYLFSGELPPCFHEAMNEIKTVLPVTEDPAGVPVEVVRMEHLLVEKREKHIRLGWAKPVQLYRAVSLLYAAEGEKEYIRREQPCFETGIMIDASRNAVPKISTLRRILCRMALMGMDVGMMYTEDTYEVPGEPYIGYMRGRYSQAELKELDDYASLFGIEMIPCVQTLGHLNRMLHWPAMAKYADNGEVLLADEEETYALLKRMLTAACAPYRSRRIHIGMDEAHGVGLGEHLRRNGYENPHAIIGRHLKRVLAIAKELGLSPMMWSDMYFRPDSPTNAYYDAEPSRESVESVVPGVKLVYWDYYHNTEEEYADMLRKHKKLAEQVYFAGGVWTWTGPAPDYVKALQATVPALKACKNAGVPFALATAWGDNGAEANLLTALPGMQLYAEFSYTGDYDPELLAERFRVCCGEDIAPFLQLSRFNTIPGMCSGELRPVNAAKFLLYQDPMVQLFAADTAGVQMSGHYRELADYYGELAKKGGTYALLMEFYACLADTLSRKCVWHEEVQKAVREKNLRRCRELAEGLQETMESAGKLRRVWRSLWDSTNKPYGFEILDGRMGAVLARLETAQYRMRSWLAGREEENLPELLEQVLPYTKREDGTLFGSYAVGEIVSACKIDN